MGVDDLADYRLAGSHVRILLDLALTHQGDADRASSGRGRSRLGGCT
jgi:hypothetical protein